MPIISTLIQFLIAGLLQIDVNQLWWVGYGLNCICCSIDYYYVKKAGYKAGKLMGAFLFLIPLYIYKRMAMVKGRKWLFTVIWTAVFVADLMIPQVFWVKAVGMSNPGVIRCVKEGIFYNYSDVTIGDLFDDSMEHSVWDTYMGANRKILVSVTGKVEGDRAVVTFEVGTDNSIEVSGINIEGTRCSKSEINAVIEYLYENR